MRFLLSTYANGGNTTKGDKLFKLKDSNVIGQVSLNWSQNEILKLLLLIGQKSETVSKQSLSIHRESHMTTW